MLRLRIPATTANIGPGFDIFGMALGYYNYMEVEEAASLKVELEGEGKQYLSLGRNNLTIRSAQAVYDMAEAGPLNLSFKMNNNIPLARGMGSSAAAIVGGIVAANEMLGRPLNTDELLKLAIKIEGHPDNVSPALLGGFVITAADNDGIRTFRFLPPPDLKMVVVIPELRLTTEKARAAIPKKVPVTDAIFNMSHATLLALALNNGDLDLFSEMLKDRLHQPYRLPLIQGAEDVVPAALSAGALGCVLSGSGSTMMAFAREGAELAAIGEAMIRAFEKNDVVSRYVSVDADNEGVKILSEDFEA